MGECVRFLNARVIKILKNQTKCTLVFELAELQNTALEHAHRAMDCAN